MLTIPKNKIAITPIFDANESKGGIIIPEIAKERCDQGIVKYVGEEVKGIYPGDYVLFSGYSGTLIALEGEGNLIIMYSKDIRAKLHAPNTIIDGLYYRVHNDDYSGYDYIPANYEDISELIAQAYQDTDFFKQTRIKNIMADKDVSGKENENEY